MTECFGFVAFALLLPKGAWVFFNSALAALFDDSGKGDS
jgi:hypothetical protein